MIVSRSHGTSAAESVVTVPPQRSTTSSPSSVIASDAPTSFGSLPSAKLAANASRIDVEAFVTRPLDVHAPTVALGVTPGMLEP